MKAQILAAFIATLASWSSLQANVVFFDNFDYGNGSLTNFSGTAPGSTWTNHSGTGTFIQVTNGVAYTVSGGGSREDVSAPLAGGPYTNDFLFVGFDLNLAQDFAGAGDYFIHFKDNTTGFRSRVFVTDTNTPGGGDFTLGIDNDGPAATVQWGEGLFTNTTYRVVLGYDITNRLSTPWVNPLTIASSNITDNVAGSLIAVTQIALRQGSTANGVQGIDNLVVGTTFESVITPVPEPSHIALMVVGGLGLAAYRFRAARRR